MSVAGKKLSKQELWEEKAKKILEGKKIISVRYMTNQEAEENGFDNKLNKTKSILKCEEIHQYSFTFDDAKDAFNTLGHTFQGFLCICMFCQARFYITNFMVKILNKLFHKDVVPKNNTIDNNMTMQTPRNNQFYTQSEIYFIKID